MEESEQNASEERQSTERKAEHISGNVKGQTIKKIVKIDKNFNFLFENEWHSLLKCSIKLCQRLEQERIKCAFLSPQMVKSASSSIATKKCVLAGVRSGPRSYSTWKRVSVDETVQETAFLKSPSDGYSRAGPLNGLTTNTKFSLKTDSQVSEVVFEKQMQYLLRFRSCTCVAVFWIELQFGWVRANLESLDIAKHTDEIYSNLSQKTSNLYVIVPQ